MTKKKIISFALAVMTAANMCVALTVNAASTPIENLVLGGDMESGIPTGFAKVANTTTVDNVEEAIGSEVNKVLKVTSTAKAAIKTGIELTNGNTYAFEAKMKSGSGEKTINIVSIGSSMLASPVNTASINITEEWETVSGKLTVTGNNLTLRIQPADNGATWYIDDVEIYDITNAKEITVPSTVKITSGAVEFDSKWYANIDSTVTLKSADSNKDLTNVGVTDENNNSVNVSEADGEYTFTMPNTDAVIAATEIVAPFELDSWELEGANTNIDPLTTSSIWLDFSGTVDGTTLANITGLPAGASADIDTSDDTKVVISFSENLSENTTYTIGFSSLASEAGASPTSPTSVSFTTAEYPEMTFESAIDGTENVERNVGSVIIESTQDLDGSTVNTDNITIAPAASGYSVEKTGNRQITVTFGELAANTPYTITVSNAVRSTEPMVETVADTFTFTTGQYPTASFVSTSIENNATNVSPYVSTITFEYNNNLDTTTVNNSSVIVSPAVDYTVDADGKVIAVTFGEQLEENTEYTITVKNTVKALHGMDADTPTVKFETGEGLKNLVKNSDYETDAIDLKAVLSRATVVTDGDDRVLEWVPSGDYASLYAGNPTIGLQANHKYFMAAKVKSDSNIKVFWQASYKGDNGTEWSPNMGTTEIVAGEDYATVFAVHTMTKKGSIRLYTRNVGCKIWVDDFILYDITDAPSGTPSVVSVIPANNADEVSPFTKEIRVAFDKPMNPSTFGGVTINNGAIITSRSINDNLTECILKVSGLTENITYTITVPNTVKSMNGDVANVHSSNFTTGEFPPASFVASSIADGATNVSLYTSSIELKYDNAIDSSTVNNTSVTVIPAVDYTATAEENIITVAFGEELSPNVTYTINVTDAVKTQYNKTVEAKTINFAMGDYPDSHFVSSTIEDGSTNVSIYTSNVDIAYDNPIDSSTVNNTSVTVSPTVVYTAKAEGNTIKVTFGERLIENTEYIITVTNSVKALHNKNADAKTIKFKTDDGFRNLIKNGGFDTDVIDVDDANSGTKVNIVELEDGNRVLRWLPSFDYAPLYAGITRTTLLPSHKYYMSVKVKSDTDRSVVWQANYPNAGSNNSVWGPDMGTTTIVKDADFVTVSAEHTVSSSIPEEGVGGRFRLYTRVVGGTVWVDDFMFYDMTLAPSGTPSVVSVTPENNANEISPFTEEIRITFDKPMKPSSFSNITIDNGVTVTASNVNKDLTECILKVSGLAVNTTYTVNIPQAVTSMHGDAVNVSSTTFSTWTVGNTFGQVTKGIDNMDANAKLDTGVIHLEFAEYVDKTTLIPENFTVSYSIGGGSPVSVTPTDIIKNDREVKLVLPATAVKNGATYTISTSSAIKSMANVALESSDVVFTTKSVADIESNFTSIENATDAKAFMENDYKDMLQNNDLYDSILAGNNEAVKNAIYADLADSTSTTQNGIIKEINDAIVVAMANNSATDAEAKELILSAALGLDKTESDGTNAINIYKNTLTNDQRTEFNTLINNKSFTSTTTDGIRSEIAEELLLFTVRNSESWGPIQQAVENSKAYFGANVTDVTSIVNNTNKLGIQDTVYRPLQGYVAANMAGFYSQLSTCYEAAVASANEQRPQGGGGGGGGGVFSGPALVTNTNIVQNEQKDATAVTIFSDLASHSWAVEAIDNLFARGIVSGKEKGVFAPGDSVTRNEFVKMMVMTVDMYDKSATVDFRDLPSTHWSYTYVASAVKAGLVNGIGEGLFGTDGRMSRQDVAVLVYNAIKDKNIATQAVAGFKDIDKASDYAKEAVTFLRKIGVVNGDENGNYNPQASLTRAEAAVILNAVLAFFN